MNEKRGPAIHVANVFTDQLQICRQHAIGHKVVDNGLKRLPGFMVERHARFCALVVPEAMLIIPFEPIERDENKPRFSSSRGQAPLHFVEITGPMHFVANNQKERWRVPQM